MINYSSYKKLVISGNIAELYEYQYPIIMGITRKNSGRGNEKYTDVTTKIENRKKTQYRARKNVYRIINSNAFQLKKFITLTFEENLTDIKKANRYFKTFIQRLNYYLKTNHKPKLKYIAVIEFQTRGAIHYHLLCNAPYIQNKTLNEIWGNGFVKINNIDNVDNVGAYVTKYMNKDLTDERLQGQKCYLISKNLEKSIKTTNEKIISSLLPQFDIKREYKINYTTEYNGNVVYTQYILKHDIKNLYNSIYERQNISNFVILHKLPPKEQSFRKPFAKGLSADKQLTFEL